MVALPRDWLMRMGGLLLVLLMGLHVVLPDWHRITGHALDGHAGCPAAVAPDACASVSDAHPATEACPICQQSQVASAVVLPTPCPAALAATPVVERRLALAGGACQPRPDVRACGARGPPAV